MLIGRTTVNPLTTPPIRAMMNAVQKDEKVKFTQAQSDILEEIGNTNTINNYAQRMRAIQPLLDHHIISKTVIYDSKDGLAIGYHWELI